MLDSRGELMHIVADNALSALIPVSSAADTYNTQADRSLDSRERITQPSLVSSVTKSAIHTSGGVCDTTSDGGALTTSHSSTAVQQIQELRNVASKKNTLRSAHTPEQWTEKMKNSVQQSSTDSASPQQWTEKNEKFCPAEQHS
jgi:hypothetical protein